MKIYTLVRTELHNDANIWHFPTLSMAQGKMCDECTEIVGQHCSLNSTTKTPNWDCEIAKYYATCSNGNRIEFEIIEKDIELRDFILQTIADRVIALYPNCNTYFDIVYDNLTGFNDDELPRTTKEIDHFIDCELIETMSMQAAKIISGGDEEINTICNDYIDNHCNIEQLVKTLNHDAETIYEIQIGINKDQKEDIFKKDYVWVCESKWQNGQHFDNEVSINVFKSYDSARSKMLEQQEKVISSFEVYYEQDYVKSYEKDDLFQVVDKGVHDVWEGKIIKKYIED